MLHAHPVRLMGSGALVVVATLHTAGAFFLVAFVIAHIYLTTTGETPVSNLRAMLTGHEDLAVEPAPAATGTAIGATPIGDRA
jgi:hypothetical protein